MTSPIIEPVLVLLTATFAALFVITVSSLIMREMTPASVSALADYTGTRIAVSPIERFGLWLMRRFPALGERATMTRYRRWLELTDSAPSTASVLGLVVSLLLAGLVLAGVTGQPIFLVLGLLGLGFPFVRMRSRAMTIRRQVERALPDLAALMAAEMAAGNPPDKALRRAAEWGGPLAALIRSAVRTSATTGAPLFGRDRTEGVLVRLVSNYDLISLQAFIRQLDMAARKGVAGPEQMQRLANTLIIAHKERALREAEKLDGQLAVPAVVFFFTPFLFLLLAPLLFPLLEALG